MVEWKLNSFIKYVFITSRFESLPSHADQLHEFERVEKRQLQILFRFF